MITISRRNAYVAAAILAAGISLTGIGLAAATGAEQPTIVTYEDGSFTVDYHDGSAPAVGTLPNSTAAND